EHIKGPADAKDEGCTGESCAAALGIENFAVKAIQGRGVLVDLYAHYGEERRLVGYADLRRVMDADGVTVETGDMLLLRTGFAEIIVSMNRHPDMNRLN